MENILELFKVLLISDYLLLGSILIFIIIYNYLGLSIILKSYLGLIIGLSLFSFINLVLNSLNDNDIGLMFLRDLLLDNKTLFLNISFLFIPIFAIIMPLNSLIEFKTSKNKNINTIICLLFGLFFIPFLISIFTLIINNKFLFALNYEYIDGLKNLKITVVLNNFFQNSIVYNFIFKYDYLINIFIILYIFYSLTIGGVINGIVFSFFDFIKNKLKKKTLSKKEFEPKPDSE